MQHIKHQWHGALHPVFSQWPLHHVPHRPPLRKRCLLTRDRTPPTILTVLSPSDPLEVCSLNFVGQEWEGEQPHDSAVPYVIILWLQVLIKRLVQITGRVYDDDPKIRFPDKNIVQSLTCGEAI